MKLITKIRQINRKRNQLKKEVKYQLSLLSASVKWPRAKTNKNDKKFIKTILLIRNDGKIGDAIVSTCFLKPLYEAGIQVDVLAVKANEVIFRNNPHVRSVYLSESVPSGSKDNRFHHGVQPDTLEILRCNEYDLLIDTALWNTGLYMPKLIRDVSPHAVLGFNKPAWLRQYDFNLNFSFEKKHVKNIYVSILEFLNQNVERDLHYEIFYPDTIDEDIEKTGFFSNEKENVLINIYASHEDRDLSKTQLDELLRGIKEKFPSENIIVIDHKKELETLCLTGVSVYIPPSLVHAIAAVKASDMVISPDTAIVHVAATFNKRLIGIYQNLARNNKLWSPGYENGHQVFSESFTFRKDPDLVKRIVLRKAEIDS